jgi:hypothetical protein
MEVSDEVHRGKEKDRSTYHTVRTLGSLSVDTASASAGVVGA